MTKRAGMTKKVGMTKNNVVTNIHKYLRYPMI